MTDIAIIGGGAAGAAVFGELLKQEDTGTVHWIVGRSAPGRGVAYATDDERHLLNVRAAGMGVFTEQSEEFVQYAAREQASVQATEFLPRRLFGEFVEAQVESRIQMARTCGRRFAIHVDQVWGLHRSRGGGYRLDLASATLDVDATVLATGALAPRPLKAVADEALASGAYELNPWSVQQRAVSPRRVLVIGTGLTSVDTLISASTRWPHAELVAVSRHGQMPFCHSSQPLAPYPFQSDLNASLLDCDGVAPMLWLIREAMRDRRNSDWRAVIDGMRSVNARLWQGFTLKQRHQFMRHVRWIWEAVRHRTAPQSFETVEALRESGRLQVHAARVLSVTGSGPLDVTVRSRTTQLMSTFQADLVIQAIGLDTAVAYAADPLLSQLLRDGLAVADPLQLGIAARPDGQLVDRQGQPQAGLYAIGSLLRGNLWECTAMPEIRSAAHQLGQTLCRRAASGVSTGSSAEA